MAEPPPTSTRTEVPPSAEQPAVQEGNGSLLRAAPGLARIAAGAWLRTAEWTAVATVRTTERVARAAVDGQTAAELLDDLSSEMRVQARRLLGIVDEVGERMGGNADGARPVDQPTQAANDQPEHADGSLRDRGRELLRQSSDLRYEEPTHPAYERILGELAPDEARILRLLAQEGAQATVDVRTWRPLDVGSELVAPGLSMIGAQAGVRYLERVPSYLDNLNRLGLIWFSREALPDPTRYQVLEAQPEVGEALRKAGRGRIVRRSIHLTPFGNGFCDVSLPLDTAEIAALQPDTGGGSD